MLVLCNRNKENIRPKTYLPKTAQYAATKAKCIPEMENKCAVPVDCNNAQSCLLNLSRYPKDKAAIQGM
ncbi:hypothetical protein GCM10007852_13720 [Agaribacter marinus]|uniref:Uncharacterized protein n=1 Tax=Agaribacter marinus TaxID=1431249 RepID=A0AA37SY66_9ALTE|nr:hypothetical protein GCM10007852_13720 [Agaribacter marinus]